MNLKHPQLKTELLWLGGIVVITILLLAFLSETVGTIALHDTDILISVLPNIMRGFLFLALIVFLVKEGLKGFKSLYGCIILSFLFIVSALYLIEIDVAIYLFKERISEMNVPSMKNTGNAFLKQLQQMIIFQCLLLLLGLIFGYRSWKLKRKSLTNA